MRRSPDHLERSYGFDAIKLPIALAASAVVFVAREVPEMARSALRQRRSHRKQIK